MSQMNEKKMKRNDDQQSTKENYNIEKSYKVALISGSSNCDKVLDNSVFLREDNSTVIVKIQNSPVKKEFNNESLVNSSFNEPKKISVIEDNSQKVFESIMVLKS